MSISQKDIKLLWGRAGGRCSYCNIDLTRVVQDDNVIVGEMAHVIARRQDGPRGSENVDKKVLNTYENLILLCNNHHEMIDKTPQRFSVEQILGWKKNHEERVRRNLEGERFSNGNELFSVLKRLLTENEHIFDQYGPKSFVARRNPLSDVKDKWDIFKVTMLIPNNKRIINIIEDNQTYFSDEEYNVFQKFKAHALSFENNAYERMDDDCVLTFPVEFKNLIFNGGFNNGKE
jgi:hypothetical protein